MSTLLRLTAANIRSLVRDRAALFWTFFFPVMFVFLFGWIFGGSGDSKVAIGFVDQDNTQVSMGLQQAFSGVKLLTVKTGSFEAEKAAMQHGDISAFVVVPSGTGAAVAAKSATSIQLYVDPSSSQVSQVVEQIADQIVGASNLRLAGGSEVVKVQQMTLQSTNISNVAYLVPSILAMALMQLGVFAAIPLVQQREKGILKRIGATPLARWKLVGSNVLMRLMVAIVDAVVILGIGLVFFNVQIVGNLLVAAGLVLLGAGAFLAIGFALASFLKTEEQATGVVQVVQMPMMFLSGIFFSFDFLPGFLQTIARFMPLTYLGDALRQVMVNGTQVAPLGVDVAILAGWLVVCLGIAARSFRWE
ncbi:MAG: ABC transporter permease [Candidatus Limnocylindrales bacterium]|jgi:ABC-2 type transport system permease protein